LFRKETDGSNEDAFTAGGIISTEKFGYGSYEARMRLYYGSYGFHQSFWMTNGIQDINGFEFDSRLTGYSYLYPSCYNRLKPSETRPEGEYFRFNYKLPKMAISGWPNNPYGAEFVKDSLTDWIRYRYDWTPTGIRMYLNDADYGSIVMKGEKGTDFNTLYSPSKVWITGVPFKIYPNTDIVVPHINAKMQIAHFSYKVRRYPGRNILGDSSFNLVKSTGLEQIRLSSCWNTNQIGDFSVSDDPKARNSYVIDSNIYNVDSKCLEQKNTQMEYQTNAYQTIYLCKGTYQLNATIQCSAHADSEKGFMFMVLDSDNRVIALRNIKNIQRNWLSLTVLSNIVVSTNKITILIRSCGKKGEWARVNDISFVNVDK